MDTGPTTATLCLCCSLIPAGVCESPECRQAACVQVACRLRAACSMQRAEWIVTNHGFPSHPQSMGGASLLRSTRQYLLCLFPSFR